MSSVLSLWLAVLFLSLRLCAQTAPPTIQQPAEASKVSSGATAVAALPANKMEQTSNLNEKNAGAATMAHSSSRQVAVLASLEAGRSESGNGPSAGGGPAITIENPSPIEHIVFIIRENRTFDNYFGTFPGANGATSAKISTGQTIPLSHLSDRMPRDIDHSWVAAKTAINNGQMDGFDKIPSANQKDDYLAFSQLYEADIPNYWAYARNFVLGDNMFSSMKGPTFPNHLYIVAAQAGGVINNPSAGGHGCDAPMTSRVQVLDPATGKTSLVYPCFDFATLADTLQAAGLTWKYYAPTLAQLGNRPYSPLDAIAHIRNSSLWTTNVPHFSSFASDALNGRLANFNWLVSTDPLSEHPPVSVCAGENWVVQQINAIMQGPDWNSTAIFITWDDFGGLYDHAPPPAADAYGFGLRVPLLIISPYAKRGYITHTLHEFSSILKFAALNFGLPTLADRDAAANDLLDAFDFNQGPGEPLILSPRACPASTYVSTRTVTFAPQTVGTTSAAQIVKVRNLGAAVLTIAGVAVSGENYSLAATTCSPRLAVSGTCTVSVTFSPASQGPASGMLTVTDSSVGSPHQVELKGAGTVVSLYPLSLAFGDQEINTSSAPQTVLLTNTGATPLTINGIVISSVTGSYRKYFSQTNTCIPAGSTFGVVAPGGSCSLDLTFKPATKGAFTSTLTVLDDGGGSGEVISLTGRGI